jgi:beta-glucosidase
MTEIDVDALLSQLTLDEKAALVTGASFWNTVSVDRLGIPAITMSDGPHGIRRQPDDREGGIGGSYPATCFPPAVALGSSWDLDLTRRVGEALGREAAALDVQVLLGPGINIKRSPLCGRNFEYLSEDPLIAGSLGGALISGIQSQGVGTSLKHFAANNQETDRLRVSADVDERTLREIYLAGFERAIADARPMTVMASYNRINGVYATENRWLLTDVLRDEWGFDGLVVSDWGAVNDRDKGVAAGLDLEMPSSGDAGPSAVVRAVTAGELREEDLDEAVRNVLRLVARTLPEVRVPDPVIPDELVEADHRLAREAAARCAVLLKNDGGILPLSPGASVAVIGEFARTPRYQGAGSSQIVPTRLDDALTAIGAIATAEPGFAPGYRIGEDEVDEALLTEALDLAREADVAVVFLGLPASAESEGFDRLDIDLPAAQLELLRAVAAVNENVVVVLSNGSVVRTAGWEDGAKAVLEGWLLGQAGGGALADLLYGIENPSGRLAETIPVRLEDTPAYLSFPGSGGHVRYGEGVFVGYRWYDARDAGVGYPFGHGLSYTTFGYSDLAVRVSGHGEQLAVDVDVTVTNTGDRAGREVVQLYVAAPAAETERPERELRGFAVVALEPGESRTVTLPLRWRDFAYFGVSEAAWIVEAGTAHVHVGASSRDLRLSAPVELPVDPIVPSLGRESSLAEWLAHPGGSRVLGEALQSVPGAGGFLSDEMLAVVGTMPLRRIGRFPGFGLDDAALDAMIAQANAL